MLKAKVEVTLKQEVSDPQGHAVREALENLHSGFAGRVRQGKVFDIDLLGTDKAEAEKQLDKICHELLSNPIIEEYHFEIVEAAS